MPKDSLVAVNGSGGAFTSISASIPAHSVQIVEDASVAQQGLEVQFAADGFAVTRTYPAGQPIDITGNGLTGVLAYPAQGTAGQTDYRAAGVYCKVRSATATATTVAVLESET